MAKKRTLLLLKVPEPGADTMSPLGSFDHVCQTLARFNTAPDGSGPLGFGERLGTGVFHGPGMVMEVALNDVDPDAEIAQMLVGVTDEDFAWPVLSRLCKSARWKMVDPESGRSFLG